MNAYEQAFADWWSAKNGHAELMRQTMPFARTKEGQFALKSAFLAGVIGR